MFDRLDVVAALQTDNDLQGRYAARSATADARQPNAFDNWDSRYRFE